MPAEKISFHVLYRPFIDKIRAHRMSMAISQTELALNAGYSRKYVTLIESGERTPSVEALFAIAAQAGMAKEDAEELCKLILNQFAWGDSKEA